MGENKQVSAWKSGKHGSESRGGVAELRLALGFRIAVRRVRSRGRGVCGLGGLVLHAFFERAEAFADPFAQFRQFLRPENEQGNEENDQQMHWLK